MTNGIIQSYAIHIQKATVFLDFFEKNSYSNREYATFLQQWFLIGTVYFLQMNVTALARKLKTTTTELFDVLPSLGFDIGRRAIKIDDRTAQKIIANWPQYKKRLAQQRERDARKLAAEEQMLQPQTVVIPSSLTVREFAEKTKINVSRVLQELMKNGIFVSMNERIDADTASIIGSDLNVEVQVIEGGEVAEDKSARLKEKIIAGTGSLKRPPVIVVMGHVDHGKTKLLDAIRKTDVVAGEAGGITQHIGAYQIERNGNTITFIDTPGHQVFTAMRSRGAKVADVAVLVVAADDSVKPQTVEAYHIIEQSKLPFVVAINKIDKADADVERVKSDLVNQLKIAPEEWGGKTLIVPVSAHTKEGIPELLDAIVLVAEMEGDKIKADPDVPGVGTVIEAHVDKGEGPVATILVQNGTLRAGDIVVLDDQPLGRIRTMKNHNGELVATAGPAMPVRVAGLKAAPTTGDIVEVVEDVLRLKLNKVKRQLQRTSSSASEETADSENVKKLNVIVKSDVLGSAEAIEESLVKLNTQDIKVKVIKKGLGNVTEGDIDRALASEAIVLGFNVNVPTPVQLLAREKEVVVKNYTIIYELVDYIKEELQKRLGMEIVREDIGKLNVLAIFKTEHKSQILGGKVIAGHIERDAMIDVLRGEEFITRGSLTNLQAGKEDVNRVEAGQECGLQFKGEPVIQIGDTLEFYTEKKVMKKLEG